ncbi:unnamed protein product [Meloidogyne enterolobii]|uniref:Uncharacterized protein n=1 Tax=Meloidogyne enterolobii TaxID=390850 RepID=A0ACB1B1Y3_MELEN
MAKESSKICSSSNLLPKRIFSSISGRVQDKEEEVIQLDSSSRRQPSSIHQSLSTAKESSKNVAQESSEISSITNLLPSRSIFSFFNEEEEESREVIQLEDTSIVQSKFNVFDSMRDSHHQTSLSLNTAKSPSNIEENIPRDETVPHSFAPKKNLSQKIFSTSRVQQEHKSSEKSSSFNLEVEVVKEGESVLDEEENEEEKEEEEMEENEEELEEGEDEVKDEEEIEEQEGEMEENEEEREDEEDEVNDEEEEGDVEEQGVEMEENEEAELEDEEIEVECQEPSKSVEIQLVSTAKEFSKNLSRKSSKLSSNLPPKRIFSSVCEEVEEGQNVIHLDSASFIQQQSCSRIRQSLSTAKEISTRSKVQSHSKNLSTRNLEELENTPPPSTSQQHQPRQRAVENLNRNASIRNSRRLSLSPWRQPQEFTHVLQHCTNGYIMTWDEFLDRTEFECLRKLGEGDYGEVYEISDSKGTYAMKVIQVTEENPIPVIFSEVFITRHLSELNNAGDFSTPSYIPLVRANVVKGIYPDILIKKWKKYKKQNPKIALNKRPTEHIDNTYVVLVMANGGVDLEQYLDKPGKATKKQRFSIFYQVALSLAIAEERHCFEHRDLHVSNILISKITSRERERRDKICYYYNGEKIEVRSHGLHASLIDFNNSRMTDDVTKQSVFVKFAVTPYKEGDDYQYKIYPMMKELNESVYFLLKINKFSHPLPEMEKMRKF